MNNELLRDAIAIIDGIPVTRVRLLRWQQPHGRREPIVTKDDVIRNVKDIQCDTLACAGGWLALHPTFQKLGLKVGRYYTGEPTRVGSTEQRYPGIHAFATLFDIEFGEAQALFRSRRLYEDQHYDQFNDKQLWLHRAYVLLTDREGFRKEFLEQFGISLADGSHAG